MSVATLTKQDFERIAGTLSDLRQAIEAIATDPPGYQVSRRQRAFDSACADIAKVLQKTNGKFEASRFMASCKGK